MAGTNAVAFKRALIDKVAAFPALETVQVCYSWPGRDFERECIHGGRVEGVQKYATFAGGRARLPRDEEFVVHLFVAVRIPGAEDGYEVEARLGELGQALEDGIAAAPQFDTVTGLLYVEITGLDMDSYPDNEAWAGILDYSMTVHSRLN